MSFQVLAIPSGFCSFVVLLIVQSLFLTHFFACIVPTVALYGVH